MPEELSNWTAHFVFHNKPLTETELRNRIPNIEFETDSCQPHPTGPARIRLIGFTITVPNATMQKARFEAEGKANIIFNFLTSVHCYPIRGHLTNITSDRGEGIATVNVDTILHADMVIDLSDISRLIDSCNERQLRQLAHYSRGVEAADIITKFREFYQVFEEEIGIVTPPTRDWPRANVIESMTVEELEDYQILRFIRNLVNHPVLDRGEPKAIADLLMVRPSLDLNNPEELELIKRYLRGFL